MTGNDILERLQSFSQEELDQEVYICGADCMFYYPNKLSILDEDRYDEDREEKVPKGTIIIDW